MRITTESMDLFKKISQETKNINPSIDFNDPKNFRKFVELFNTHAEYPKYKEMTGCEDAK